MQVSRRNLYSISFSQFGAAFSGNFIKIFLPFYILKISPYSPQQTLLWIGAIMACTPFCAAFTSTFWGSLTHRYSPKWLYLRTLLVNTISFFLMGFTTNLYFLFVLRILQGLMSGSSTIGLIIVSSTSSQERVSSDIGLFQASMTCGQLVGPLLGSLAAGALGYRGAFISASCVLFLSLDLLFFLRDQYSEITPKTHCCYTTEDPGQAGHGLLDALFYRHDPADVPAQCPSAGL